MSEYAQLLDTIKRAAVEAVAAAKPFAVTYGTVIKDSPLTISVDQKLELGPAQLLLSNAVREYKVDMTVEDWTENETAHIHAVNDTYTGGGSSQTTTHRHEYKGRKKITVHLGLKQGEKVLLLRVQGGQQYIVLDRVEVPQ